jgi:hypothetical protein
VSIGVARPYPPQACRFATYTESLIRAIAGERATGTRLGVVDVADDDRTVDPCQAVHRRVGDDAGPFDRAGEVWNTFDTVSMQHEFGILAGSDSAAVLDHEPWPGPAGGWPRPSIGRRLTGSLTESTESGTVVETGEARLEAVRVTV